MGIFSGEQMPSIKREMELLDEKEAARWKVDWSKSPEGLAEDYLNHVKSESGEEGYVCEGNDGRIYCVTGKGPPSWPNVKEAYPFDSEEAKRLMTEKWRVFKEQNDKFMGQPGSEVEEKEQPE
jgi:hypothetical protein